MLEATINEEEKKYHSFHLKPNCPSKVLKIDVSLASFLRAISANLFWDLVPTLLAVNLLKLHDEGWCV